MTPAQCRAARGLLDWKQKNLTDATGKDIARTQVSEFEAGKDRRCGPHVQARLKGSLEQAGIEFIPNGVRLRV